MGDFASDFREAIGSRHSMVMFCNCSITYDGRAQSFLTDGDRMVILKSDKTLLVHQPMGNTPINYMKEGTAHELHNLGDGSYLLKSRNDPLKEYMDIVINKVHHFHSLNLEDDKRIIIKGTEKDMAELIMKKPSLISADFKPVGMEEQTKYGFIDVMGRDSEGNLVIVECKRYTGDLKAVSQLRRYVERVKIEKGIEGVKGILACPKISPNALKMLRDFGYIYVAVEPPNYLERYKSPQKSLVEF